MADNWKLPLVLWLLDLSNMATCFIETNKDLPTRWKLSLFLTNHQSDVMSLCYILLFRQVTRSSPHPRGEHDTRVWIPRGEIIGYHLRSCLFYPSSLLQCLFDFLCLFSSTSNYISQSFPFLPFFLSFSIIFLMTSSNISFQISVLLFSCAIFAWLQVTYLFRLFKSWFQSQPPTPYDHFLTRSLCPLQSLEGEKKI